MDKVMEELKPIRSYDFPSYDTCFHEFIDNGSGCYHYDVLIGDDDEGIGFDTVGQLSESVLRQIARIADHTAKIYRAYGVEAAQCSMRMALGLI
jgi:hypothetical protein